MNGFMCSILYVGTIYGVWNVEVGRFIYCVESI